ncbi:hypothetical protein AYO20_07886 [Fonsecaea nubica]|uniref:Uncharacterized protein n=1 Tax=Fonsecaea nubica TaxID=856822 RepID=A0A178CT01_9EURO|nr:hypothetical protein AYO20_07886 [Fonsecaea nubica]OAL32576.1 hypothetical protein AYO20_07886 [Fonsecaea nubica]
MADADALPSYNALFPQEEANPVVNGRRRYTTITLREIYYPGGCPCHPKEQKLSKKRKAKQEPQRPPNTESEQREFESLGEQQHRQFFESDEHRQFQHEWHGPIRRFEILKSATLGLVCPQNLVLSVVDVGARTVPTDHLTNISTLQSSRHEPAFVTSKMKWWKEKFFLPPSFQIFPGTAHQLHPQHTGLQGEEAAQTEIEGPGQLPRPHPPSQRSVRHIYTNPSADPVDVLVKTKSSKSLDGSKRDEDPYPLAEIKYQGLQGLTRMSISLTLYNISPEMHYSPSAQELHSIRSNYTIARRGWKREYTLSISPSSPVYKWHSPLRHNSEVLSMPAVDDGFDLANGNLLLEDPHGTLVAVYKQRRDHQYLGALTIFLANVAGGPSGVNHHHVKANGSEPRQRQEQGHGNGHGREYRQRERTHGRGDGGIESCDERISIDAVVTSCLAVVMYERIGWQNLLGH